jgi:hypothetical protein
MSLNNAFAQRSSGGRGKHFSTIDFELNPNVTTATMRQNSTHTIVGDLTIGQQSYSLNVNEIDHLIDTLQRAKDVIYKKYTMNLL